MLISKFGDRTYWLNGQQITDYHLGIDIVANIDGVGGFDYILAVASGTVELAINDIPGYVGGASYGNQVVINHGNGYKTRYAHLKQNSVPVKNGDSVQAGQVIGYMGATGTVTAGHLHFEVIKDNNVIDPYDYIFGDKTFELLNVTPVVERDANKDQLRVLVSDLNVYVNTGINEQVIGLAIENGIYNYYETKSVDGYTWYKIAEGQWIVYNNERVLLLPKKIEGPNTGNENPLPGTGNSNSGSKNKPKNNFCKRIIDSFKNLFKNKK